MPSRRDDAGFSLPELLMVMLLSSVVLAALAVTFTSSMRAARASSARVSTTDGRRPHRHGRHAPPVAGGGHPARKVQRLRHVWHGRWD
jgi:prepilin-type N-terminal cleavage/methylation domain-containing protein